MKCTCKQCGETFSLTDSQIKFYKEKKLHLPKRCERCRKQNKEQKLKELDKLPEHKQDNDFNKGMLKKRKDIYALAAVVFILFAAGYLFLNGGPKIFNDNNEEYVSLYATRSSVVTAPCITPDSTAIAYNSNSEETSQNIKFRNENLLNKHYEKHGKEMGFSSASEYEAAAAKAVQNVKALHKIEREDGDDVYYLQSTNEFVIVSKDGYIRTYFKPDDGIEYYNRQ